MTKRKLPQIMAEGAHWFGENGWTVFPFQAQAWRAYSSGKNGIINAPTGSGKTYSMLIPILCNHKHLKKKRIKSDMGQSYSGIDKGDS